jgi:hypothetical protein
MGVKHGRGGALEMVRLLVAAGAKLSEEDDDEGRDAQQYVERIFGPWVVRPHARNEYFKLAEESTACACSCVVCLEEVTTREDLVLGACGHKMCITCYARMATEPAKDKCPECRVGGADVQMWGLFVGGRGASSAG